MNYILYYFLFINIIGCLIMFIDKNFAKRHFRRVSEKTLFFIAFIGGAFGVYLSMHLFRHKTKHWSFLILVPVFIAINLIIIYYLLILFHPQ